MWFVNQRQKLLWPSGWLKPGQIRKVGGRMGARVAGTDKPDFIDPWTKKVLQGWEKQSKQSKQSKRRASQHYLARLNV
jgi:hypothetical protein